MLNGANEVLVEKFLNEEISFIDIQRTLEEMLEKHNPTYNLGLEDIINIDQEIRKEIREKI